MSPSEDNEVSWHQLIQPAESVWQKLEKSLPPSVQMALINVPVVFEQVPSSDMVNDGLEPDTLGLFVGENMAEEPGTYPIPGQIFIFLKNIWDFVEGDPELFKTEVRRTILHEAGHYLGLDEEDLLDRDLD